MAASPLRVLVVDDEQNVRVTLSTWLEAEGYHVVAHDNIHDALADAARQAFDLVFLDVRLGTEDGMGFLPRLRQESPCAKLIVITAYASVATALNAMKDAVADYLPKPFTPAQVRLVTEKVAEQRRMEWKIGALQQALGALDPEADFLTADPATQKALEVARQAADSRAVVLITGEVGTGKGRVARAIHAWSGRGDAPFGTVLCYGRGAQELDAEVFGAATRDPPDGMPADGPPQSLGRVALCHGGTLVLEEVGDWPLTLQPKLLQLLADKEYERAHDFRPRRADVRIVATSSYDLQDAVTRNRMRPELRLALDVVRVHLPPLRQRPRDIPLLAKRYLAFFCRENRRRITGFTAPALRALRRYSWPGNVRELRNLVERAVLLCKSDLIDVRDFPPDLLNSAQAYELGDLVDLETIEQVHVRQVVRSAGTVKGAASILGINEKTLRMWLKRYPRDDAVSVEEEPHGPHGPHGPDVFEPHAPCPAPVPPALPSEAPLVDDGRP